MRHLAKIINLYVDALIQQSNEPVFYEACSCGHGNYIGFFHSTKPCLNFINMVVAHGFECNVSSNGSFFTYKLIFSFD